MSVAVSNLIIITANKQFIYRYTVYLCTDERSHWARSFFFPVSEYCLLCLLISAKVQFCWHWTEVNRSVESKSRRSSLFGHQKIREVWKTFLTLTGASPLIALSGAMDRNRLRKAVKSCEKKKKYIYICKLHTLCVLVNEYINYRCQRNGCLVHWGNHIVEHFNLDDFISVWLVVKFI